MANDYEFFVVIPDHDLPHRHDGMEDAQKKAGLLAKERPGVKMMILKSVRHAIMDDPVKFVDHDDIPF